MIDTIKQFFIDNKWASYIVIGIIIFWAIILYFLKVKDNYEKLVQNSFPQKSKKEIFWKSLLWTVLSLIIIAISVYVSYLLIPYFSVNV